MGGITLFVTLFLFLIAFGFYQWHNGIQLLQAKIRQ